MILLHDLVGVGLRSGAIRPVVIHSSGPSSHAHLMFRYTLDPEFNWSGEIELVPDSGYVALQAEPFIAEIAAATGLPEHDDVSVRTPRRRRHPTTRQLQQGARSVHRDEIVAAFARAQKIPIVVTRFSAISSD